MTIGTGVGSGLILDGKLWHGRCGFAGEIGHITVNPGPTSTLCNCGNNGCLETEVSAPRIVRNYVDMAGSGEDLTAEDIYNLARQGDAQAIESFASCGYYLGIGLGIVINLLNPGMILLGGGVMAGGEFLMDAAVRAGATALPPGIIRLRDDRQGQPGERRRPHRRGRLGPRSGLSRSLLKPVLSSRAL